MEIRLFYSVGGTRIAAITFSTKAYIMYNLGASEVDTTSKACVLTEQIKYSGGGTGTRFGLSKVLNEVKPLFGKTSNRVLIVIADGRSNMGGRCK